jgi:hypothetical protein
VVKPAERRMEIDRRFAKNSWVVQAGDRGAGDRHEEALAHVAALPRGERDRRSWSSCSTGCRILDALEHYDGRAALLQREASPESSCRCRGAAGTDEPVRLLPGQARRGGIDHVAEGPERLRANKAICRSSRDARRGFLRAEADEGGHAREQCSPRSSLVAVVLNTIDDSLKGNPSQRQRWDLTSIAPLRDLLSAARKAGRYVMLASDHGRKSRGSASMA